MLSSIWRAWSSTWIRSKAATSWVSAFFHLEVGGGLPGTLGPEVIAAIVDHDLRDAKFGASLDFKQAFDTVDLTMMREAVGSTLPCPLRSWISLVFEQWSTMRRWIIYDGSVHIDPIVAKTGLPQDRYMDDRTLVATSQQKVDQAEQAWIEEAENFHLMENTQKAQHVNGDAGQCLEVLGNMVGNPSPNAMRESKLSMRLRGAVIKNKRIAMLPLTVNERIKVANRHVLSGLSYGWVSTHQFVAPLKVIAGSPKASSTFWDDAVGGRECHSILLATLQACNDSEEGLQSVDTGAAQTHLHPSYPMAGMVK